MPARRGHRDFDKKILEFRDGKSYETAVFYSWTIWDMDWKLSCQTHAAGCPRLRGRVVGRGDTHEDL